MISFVRGRVTAARPGEVVVDVGGIGLALQCTPSTAAALRIGDEAQLPAMPDRPRRVTDPLRIRRRG